MTRPLNWLIGIAGLAFCIFAFGFIMFAVGVMRKPELNGTKADGIIVLTGGQMRINAGLDLLEVGRGKRLLITGVNRHTRKSDIARIAGGTLAMLDCCVDLGYEALNTMGNADEANEWAKKHGFSSLIVVTASYHMPRSLMELSARMPNIELTPHPVVPNGFDDREWWLDLHTSRVLFSEYVKLLPAALRLVVARAFASGHAAEPSNTAHSAGRL